VEAEEVVRQEDVGILAGIQWRKPNVIKDQTARIQTIPPTKVPWTIEQTNSIRRTLHTAEMQIRQNTQGVGDKEWIKKAHREYNHTQTKQIQIMGLRKGLKKRPNKMMRKISRTKL